MDTYDKQYREGWRDDRYVQYIRYGGKFQTGLGLQTEQYSLWSNVQMVRRDPFVKGIQRAAEYRPSYCRRTQLSGTFADVYRHEMFLTYYTK